MSSVPQCGLIDLWGIACSGTGLFNETTQSMTQECHNDRPPSRYGGWTSETKRERGTQP